MRTISYLLLGIVFGITMTKSEAISWYRILEMFRFESFHMYGIIGTAVVLGVILIQGMKYFNIRTKDGQPVVQQNAIPLNYPRHLLGGSIFGLGWALIGACPGPIYVLIGQGMAFYVLVLGAAVSGVVLYAAVKKYLPH